MQEQSLFSQAGFHVSHTVLPGSKEAKTMTVRSGRKCYESYQKYTRLASLAKMLVGSSTWGSTTVLLTWKVKVMKSRRLLFQLAPSTPRTEGTESGLLPTAHSNCSTGAGSQGREGGKNIQTAIAMLPTPRTGKMTCETAETWQKRKDAGKVSTPPLALAITLLRTPTAVECEGGVMEIRPGANAHYKLRDQIAMLPTPATRDYKGANGPEHMTKDRPHMDQLPNVIAYGIIPTPTGTDHKSRGPNSKQVGVDNLFKGENAGANRGLKLQPAFALWMMGYPEDWCDLKDGE